MFKFNANILNETDCANNHNKRERKKVNESAHYFCFQPPTPFGTACAYAQKKKMFDCPQYQESNYSLFFYNQLAANNPMMCIATISWCGVLYYVWVLGWSPPIHLMWEIPPLLLIWKIYQCERETLQPKRGSCRSEDKSTVQCQVLIYHLSPVLIVWKALWITSTIYL